MEPIISMIVTPSTPTAANGQSIDFMAIGTTPSGATKDLTTQVVWSAANKGVATIIPASGVATTQGPGTTQINAVWTNPDMTMVNGTAQLDGDRHRFFLFGTTDLDSDLSHRSFR